MMQFSNPEIMKYKLGQIRQAAVLRSIALPTWQRREGYYKAIGEYAGIQEVSPLNVGEHWWVTDGSTTWFSAQVTLPEMQAGTAVLELDFGGEGLVRINGEIVSAITSFCQPHEKYRTRVALPKELPGEIIIEAECAMNYLEFMYERAHGGGKKIEYTFKHAELLWLDEGVEAYYYDALNALEAMAVLTGTNQMRVREALLQSLALVDIDFDDERTRSCIPAARGALQSALAAIPHAADGEVILIGHSHLDTAWFWPGKETVRKAAKTFANALALMERYPDFVFAHSQPWHYAMIKEQYPVLFAKIKQRVQEGRWELLGNGWIEADTNIPSGESLVRQLLYGRAFYLKEFGICSDVYWMPDVFGYSGALPQIIKRSGMKYFYTAKLCSNDTNKFPYSLFNWQGIDGTKVPAYFSRAGYNNDLTPAFLHDAYQTVDDKVTYNKAFMPFGWGDGGGGPNPSMLEHAARLKDFPGLPSAKIARTTDYFDGVPMGGLPTWQDEIYYENHRGTYTSQADMKKNNRQCEQLLRMAEIAGVFANRLLNAPYQKEVLDTAWQALLFNQFHDVLPGSSIHHVYQDCQKSYESVRTLGHAALDGALSTLNAALNVHSPSVVVWNFLGFEHTGMVEVILPEALTHWSVSDAPCVKEQNTLRFCATVPPMGCRVYPLTEESSPELPCLTANASELESSYFIVEVGSRGEITRLYDKRAGREVLAPGGAGNRLTIYEDKPHCEAAWNIHVEYQNKSWTLADAQIDVQEVTPLYASLRVVRTFHKSTITQVITLHRDIPRIDFATHVDWQETEKMLKASFDVDVLSPMASYEIAFGALSRPTHRNTSWDQTRFEVSAHKWADLSETGYGVALMNDCKYGYDIHGNRMTLTLLRRTVDPDPWADLGEHSFTYSLFPHTGTWQEAQVERAAYQLNAPLLSQVVTGQGGTLCAGGFAQVDNPHLMLESIKQSEDGSGMVLRLYEAHGARSTATVRMALPFEKVYETNLMEDIERELPVADGAFDCSFKPFEIKTYLLKY